jgi:methionine-S-sulfoxide reductase
MEMKHQSIAILAGGCFWGMEDLLRKLPGILDTEVGYTGGSLSNPKYEDVKTGESGHAEAIQIFFNPDTISFREILFYFFRIHDPTTLNRQGNDRGTQYRSAIFYQSEEQKSIALQVKAEIEASGRWPKPIVTEIVSASAFYPAEPEHQDYLLRHPQGYTCHYVRN